jgi:hypothetical protein
MNAFVTFVVVPAIIGILFFPLVISIIKYRGGGGPTDPPSL